MIMEISRVGISWSRGRAKGSRVVWNLKQDHGLRFFTQKASNRAAVHGLKQPINERIDEEEEVGRWQRRSRKAKKRSRARGKRWRKRSTTPK